MNEFYFIKYTVLSIGFGLHFVFGDIRASESHVPIAAFAATGGVQQSSTTATASTSATATPGFIGRSATL